MHNADYHKEVTCDEHDQDEWGAYGKTQPTETWSQSSSPNNSSTNSSSNEETEDSANSDEEMQLKIQDKEY